MSARKHKNKAYNENWKAEIAAYDAECQRRDSEFYSKHIIIKDSGNSELTVEENKVLYLFLNGVSCKEIAEEVGVEEKIINGLLEVIRAKLSLTD